LDSASVRLGLLVVIELFQEDLMTHRPAEPPEFQTAAWSAEDGDDPIEFAEFTGDDAGTDAAASSAVAEDASGEVTDAADESVPPAWFRAKSDSPSGNDGSTDVPSSASQAGDVDEGVTSPSLVVAATSVSDQTRSRKRKRRKSGGQNGQRPGRGNTDAKLIETEDEEQPLNWKKDWKKLSLAWAISTASCGYGVSLLLHTLLLGGMSAIVYHSLDENISISTTITDADAMAIEFTEIMDLKIEPPGGAQAQLPQLQPIPLNAALTDISSSFLDSAASVAGKDGDEGAPGDNLGFTFSMPEGGKVVSKGSFSAWTVPEDPEPRRDYMIVIRIRLPEKTKLYRISDLSGKVEGSDFYVQHLPFDPERKDLIPRTERGGQIVPVRKNDRLRVIKNHVQIMIPVKGAASLVRDAIQVKSRMLKEDQQLEIVF
jgi:hypothetical protein